MKTSYPAWNQFRTIIIVCAFASICAGAAAEKPEAEKGFKSLFNGKNLSGWVGDEDLWKVEDGVIVGSSDKKKLRSNTFLSTKKTYSDFVLRVKVKLRNHNSGIQFRSEQKRRHVVHGYQADVATATYFGMLYEEGGRGILDYWKALPEEERAAIFAASKAGEWNEYEITCQGDNIKMVLNGKLTCDINDPDGAKDGVIALQLHAGDPMEVRFKDISIKKLSAEDKK